MPMSCEWPNTMTRRQALAGITTALAVAPLGALAAPPTSPIIDTHMHLFDPNRPQGAPYRGPETRVFYTQGASPAVYAKLMQPDGVIGAIAVEASPWIEDNLWLLESAGRSDIMVGVVGNLRPESPEFPEYLERHHKNPLFLGIRYGNIWGYDIVAQTARASFMDGLKLVAQAGLVLDSGNPRLDLLQSLVRISDAVPELRIVIDHLPKLDPTAAERGDYEAVLREIGTRPNLFVKLSAVIHSVNGHASSGLAAYAERLDLLYGVFGEDRVLFGSDWPTIEWDAPVHEEFALLKSYFAGKSRAQQEKFFWRNSVRAYRWIARSSAQRHLA
jgi:L-fuconolactonase